MIAATARVDVPFLGLRYFDEKEMHLFFGREEQVGELVEKLANSRFVSVVGSSGSGKSSLVRAGLVPALRAGLLLRNGPNWRVIIMRPGASPISALAHALERSAGMTDVEITLRRGALGLIEAVQEARLENWDNLLIVVDQFEELFRYRSQLDQNGKDEAAAFVKLLLEAAAQQQLPIYIILTMRSDYLGDCSQFRNLPERINDALYLVPRMRRDQMQQAITGPVAMADAEISRRLVQRLLNETGDDPDQLPLLQHALLRAWGTWNRAPRPLDFEDLDVIGGLAESLTRHADEIYNGFSEREQNIAKVIFQRLSERDKEGREVRRPSKITDIAGVAAASMQEVQKVVEAFAAPEVSLLYTNRSGDLDITHESLLRKWTKIRGESGQIGWLQEETNRAEEYTRLVLRSKANDLLAGPALKSALQWRQHPINPAWASRYTHTLAEFANVLTFIETSREAEERRQRARRRLWQIVMAVVIFVLAILAGATAYSWWKAKLANADRLAATSVHLAASDKDLALLLAVEAQRTEDNEDTREALVLAYETSATPMLEGHSDVVDTVAFSPDGKSVATASEDGTAGLWDWENHNQTSTLFSDPKKKVYSVAFSPDGTRVAVALSDGTVVVVNRNTPEQRTTLQASNDAIADVAINAAGDRLATASSARSPAGLWAFPALTPIARLYSQNAKVNRVAFNTQGSELATASSDQTVVLWDAQGGKQLRVFKQPAGATDVRFSPDGNWIASSASDGTFAVWNSQTGALRFRRAAHTNGNLTVAAEAIAFSADGKQVATLASNGQAKVWDAETGKPMLVITPPNVAHGPGRSIAFRPGNSDQLAIAMGPDVWLYDLSFPRLMQKSRSLLAEVTFRQEDCRQYLYSSCPTFAEKKH